MMENYSSWAILLPSICVLNCHLVPLERVSNTFILTIQDFIFLQKNITSPLSDTELKELFNNKLNSSQKLKVKDGFVKVKNNYELNKKFKNVLVLKILT